MRARTMTQKRVHATMEVVVDDGDDDDDDDGDDEEEGEDERGIRTRITRRRRNSRQKESEIATNTSRSYVSRAFHDSINSAGSSDVTPNGLAQRRLPVTANR